MESTIEFDILLTGTTHEEASRKKSRREEKDIISTLPDELLCNILSLLPATKYVFRTCILSRRWINMWTKIPVFDFKFRHFGNLPHEDESFIRFVDKVISSNVSPNIQKFALHYTENYCSGERERSLIFRINDWVQFALSRRVVELRLFLFVNGGYCGSDLQCACQQVGLWLQSTNCFSLHVLDLVLNVPLRMPSFMCFQNLKKFHLELHSVDNELTSKLFSDVPKLEELSLTLRDELTDCMDLNIIAPILKLLVLDVDDDSETLVLKILIDAPMLENVSLSHRILHSYTLRNIPANVQAKIEVGIHSDFYYVRPERENGIKLIRGLCRAKSLSLSGNTTRAIFQYADNLPLFDNLTKLELCVDPSLFYILPYYFRNTPNLEILILEMEDYMSGECNLDMSQTCSMVHLKEVEIRGGYGQTKIQVMKLLKYIMKNAEYLEKFTLNSVQMF